MSTDPQKNIDRSNQPTGEVNETFQQSQFSHQLLIVWLLWDVLVQKGRTGSLDSMNRHAVDRYHLLRPAVDSLSRSFYTFPLMLTGSCPKRLDASVKTNFVRLIYDYCSGPQPADVQDLLILTILLRVESIIIKNHRVIQMNLISHHHSLKKTTGFHLNPYFIFQLQEL